MTHNHERTHWIKEGLFAMLSGITYGATNTIVGHPFDTVKTKMQAQADVFKSHNGYIKTITEVYQKEGPIGFYRGCVPQFFGSIFYRSLQFSVFEMFFTRWEKTELLRTAIPLSGGLELRVLCAGMVAASARAFIENPFEYAKVRG